MPPPAPGSRRAPLSPGIIRGAAGALLAIALPAALAAPAAQPDACAAPRAFVERFMPADCEACWRGADAQRATRDGAPLVLDWIVPDARGEDAALAAAAIPEAAARAGALDASRTLVRQHALAPTGAGSIGVIVEQGPPWYGYIAAQVRVVRPAGSRAARAEGGASASAYLALAEQVRAGEEGTPVDRMLVRGVIGPLPLASGGEVVTHLHAFRVPQGSRPARLAAVGWVEAPGGKVIAAGRVEPDDCPPAR